MVSLDQVRKNNAAWEVSLRVKFDAPSTALESHRGWILENEAYFGMPPAGGSSLAGSSRRGNRSDEMGINYYFDLAEEPAKLELVYRTPITILDMKVDYELRDLPLP